MASSSLQTREAQKTRYLQSVEIRKTALLEKGLDEAAIKKDGQIKHLKAKVKQIDGAIGRLAFLTDQTAKLKEKKAQKLAEAEAERAAVIRGEVTGKKKKEAPPAKAAPAKGKGGGAGKAPAKGGKPGDQKKKGK